MLEQRLIVHLLIRHLDGLLLHLRRLLLLLDELLRLLTRLGARCATVLLLLILRNEAAHPIRLLSHLLLHLLRVANLLVLVRRALHGNRLWLLLIGLELLSRRGSLLLLNLLRLLWLLLPLGLLGHLLHL